MLIGYARVSKTDGSQSLNVQCDALRAEWIDDAANLAHLVNTVQDLSARGVGLRVLAGQGRRSTPPPRQAASCSAYSRRWPSSYGS